LDHCFKFKGVAFDPYDQNRNYVIIPIDFGLEPILLPEGRLAQPSRPRSQATIDKRRL